MATSTSTKTARIEARVSCGLFELIKRAAEVEGLTKTGFITRALQKEAELVIQKNEVLHLSLNDQARFAEFMLNPQEPTAALQKAFKRRRELLGVD